MKTIYNKVVNKIKDIKYLKSRVQIEFYFLYSVNVL